MDASNHCIKIVTLFISSSLIYEIHLSNVAWNTFLLTAIFWRHFEMLSHEVGKDSKVRLDQVKVSLGQVKSIPIYRFFLCLYG